MLFAVSGLQGCPIRASDGDVGVAKDFLFDDRSWKIRWMEVETGDWLPGRRVLVHSSAIAPLKLPPKPTLPMMSPGQTLELGVNLTRSQIEAGPQARADEPVTRQMELLLYDYYGWDPYWGVTHFGAGALPNSELQIVPEAVQRDSDAETFALGDDSGLHSGASVNGFHVRASDGDIGHVENLLADDSNWEIRYLIIATRNWLPGTLVQLAPYAVKDIDWFGEHINMNVRRDQVKSAPAWDPLAIADMVSEEALHRHFGWPGYGGTTAKG
jgi:hypothetical protein